MGVGSSCQWDTDRDRQGGTESTLTGGAPHSFGPRESASTPRYRHQRSNAPPPPYLYASSFWPTCTLSMCCSRYLARSPHDARLLLSRAALAPMRNSRLATSLKGGQRDGGRGRTWGRLLLSSPHGFTSLWKHKCSSDEQSHRGPFAGP